MRNLHFANDRILVSVSQLCLLSVISLFFFTGCKPNDTIQQEQLYGRWEISKAERNGKETSYLRRGYFIINQDGNMTINITGADEKGPYTMDNNKITMGEKKFVLQSLHADSLIVTYDTGPNVQFVFYMLKKQTDAQ